MLVAVVFVRYPGRFVGLLAVSHPSKSNGCEQPSDLTKLIHLLVSHLSGLFWLVPRLCRRIQEFYHLPSTNFVIFSNNHADGKSTQWFVVTKRGYAELVSLASSLFMCSRAAHTRKTFFQTKHQALHAVPRPQHAMSRYTIPIFGPDPDGDSTGGGDFDEAFLDHILASSAFAQTDDLSGYFSLPLGEDGGMMQGLDSPKEPLGSTSDSAFSPPHPASQDGHFEAAAPVRHLPPRAASARISAALEEERKPARAEEEARPAKRARTTSASSGAGTGKVASVSGRGRRGGATKDVADAASASADASKASGGSHPTAYPYAYDDMGGSEEEEEDSESDASTKSGKKREPGDRVAKR